MQILFDLNPSNLSLLNSLDPQSFIDMIQMTSPVPVSGYTVINNNDGTFSVTIDYTEDIHGQNISIEIDPSKSGLGPLSRTSPSTFSLQVIPNDNEGAYFYDDSTYKTAALISTVCTAISALALVFCVIGLISGKMVGV